MATTAIWNVKGWLGKVLIYVENPDKTDNPAVAKVEDADSSGVEGLADVLDYAMQEEKTLEHWNVKHEPETLQRFVSGVNCSPITARSEMLAVKKHYGKENGNVAYHGYQSFAPTDKVTPQLAHEIGTKLAEELWGDKFQVVVATHLDKASHLHNHFVLNSVSFLDGKKYNDCKESYRRMRDSSDRLCREYQLSVIENADKGKSLHYAEWSAKQQGQPTLLDLIKQDVDKAISESMTDKQFFFLLRKQDYSIKQGKDITVRPPGKPHGRKLCRNLGEEYSYKNICRRILQNKPKYRRRTEKPPPKSKLVQIVFHGSMKTKKKCTGLRALYYYYCYRLGFIGKQKNSPARREFIYREDVKSFEAITHEADILIRNKINTIDELHIYKAGLQDSISVLTDQRKHLRYNTKSKKGQLILPELKEEISGITEKLSILRKEVKHCGNIEARSIAMKEKIEEIGRASCRERV